MDKRRFNGSKKGERRNAGRKPKAKEIELIQQLTPLETQAFKALKNGIEKGEFNFIRLFFEYRYGKPKQIIEVKEDQDSVSTLIILPDGQKLEL